MRSQVLTILAVIVVTLALASAAPQPISSSPHLQSRTLDKVWSALELILYRLTHGGQYPPGYGSNGPTTTSLAPSKTSGTTTVRASSTKAVTTTSISVSSAKTTAASSVIAPAPTSTTVSVTSVATSSIITISSSTAALSIISSTSAVLSSSSSSDVPVTSATTATTVIAPIPVTTSQGYLYAAQIATGERAGCVISDGTWFIGGSCATYTQSVMGDSVTYKTSKGPCAVVSDGSFSCAAGNTASALTIDAAGVISYQSSSAFSADAVPPANTRQTIFAGESKAVALNLVFSTVAAPTTTTAPSSSTSSNSVAVSSSTSTTSQASYPTGTGLTICSGQSIDSFPRSCSTSSPSNTCCVESPGGHLLITEFWNTGATSVGPNSSWTVHGLWPDNCDGTYEANCDPSRELTNVTAVIEQSGDQELLAYMNTYWKSNNNNDESFWEHEFNKHGTCLSTLEPKCFNNYKPQQDAVTYFRKTVEAHKTLSSFESLAAAGIVPSLNQTYTLDQIQRALTAAHGFEVNVNCEGSVFEEIWYHYESQGSIADGKLIPAPLVGSGSTCPSTGIKYYPKYTTIPSTQPVGSAGGGVIADGGKVNIYAGPTTAFVARNNYLTSTGKWYSNGTPAGFTLGAIIGGSYTLTSSRGPCAVDGTTKLFSCGAEVTKPSEFVFASDGTITLGGVSVFSAAQTPSGQTQVPVYLSSDNAVKVVLAAIAV